MADSQYLKYSPKLIGGVNVLLYGSGYLFLHKYLRFFLFFVILLIANIFLGIIGVIISYILVIVDSTRLAKKIQKGEIQLPSVNIPLTVIIIIVIVGITAFNYTPKYLLAFSEESCNVFYPMNLFSPDYRSATENFKCKNMVKEGKTLFTFFSEKPPKDAGCESEAYQMQAPCYFRKAIDTKNYKYCYNLVYVEYCIINLAGVLKDKSLCKNIDQTKFRCSEIIQECIDGNRVEKYCKPTSFFSCDGQSWGYDPGNNKLNNCMTKYGLSSE